ncbi:alpha/beta-hydrolase [Panaeolus papilionaceus]|nr:alpha/beta-hydrolase [Panaeolus papilionaceus]
MAILIKSSMTRSSISQEKYEELFHYFKYASSAYSAICLRPNGNRLVLHISNAVTDIYGFIARDDHKKELIIALRGSASLTDVLLDSQVLLVPFLAPGVRVHSGFLVAWDSIALQVSTIVRTQLASHPDYEVVTVGHSLGGSLATLAAVALKSNFMELNVRTYSYGAPRTGNQKFAEYVNANFGELVHRVVHGNDGVPTMIPVSLGYHHHGIEYWQYTHPSSAETTVQCNAEGEDPLCSASVPSQGINRAHTNYFGILVTTPFCF